MQNLITLRLYIQKKTKEIIKFRPSLLLITSESFINKVETNH